MSSVFAADLPSILLRLIGALIVSSIFGWEREQKTEAAGLKTHMLVCLGATLITIVSESYAKPGSHLSPDVPGRLSANIVSGIGFLGAGTILVRGNVVHGLTTAATLWTAAALGIAVGRGGEYFVVAAAASLIVLFILIVIDRFENRFFAARKSQVISVTYPVGSGSEWEISAVLCEKGAQIRAIERLEITASSLYRTSFEISALPSQLPGGIESRLMALSWIRRVEWDR